MVGRLLERYALSMDAIEIRTARCVQVTVPLGGRRRRPIDGCVPAIAIQKPIDAMVEEKLIPQPVDASKYLALSYLPRPCST